MFFLLVFVFLVFLLLIVLFLVLLFRVLLLVFVLIVVLILLLLLLLLFEHFLDQVFFLQGQFEIHLGIFVFRVQGDRKWSRTMGKWKPSGAEKFERLPLRYELAFGGADLTDSDPEKQGLERRNPLGRGLAMSRNALEKMKSGLTTPDEFLKQVLC